MGKIINANLCPGLCSLASPLPHRPPTRFPRQRENITLGVKRGRWEWAAREKRLLL